MGRRLLKEVYVYFCVDCGNVVALLSKVIQEPYILDCRTCKNHSVHKPLAIDFEKRQYITTV